MKSEQNSHTCVAECNNDSSVDKRSSMMQSAAQPPVTQLSPDDVLADEGPMTPHDKNDSPDMRQIEQETIMVNPSADSMESRG